MSLFCRGDFQVFRCTLAIHNSILVPGLLAAETKPEKTNIIVILVDDMGYVDVGCFGSKLNRTPHLDQLSQAGMKLTNFYSAPLCSASRAQLLTGCHAKKTKVMLMATVENPRLDNLEKDISETSDVAAQIPEVVKRRQTFITDMDDDLGIEGGPEGKSDPGIRPTGRTDQLNALVLNGMLKTD